MTEDEYLRVSREFISSGFHPEKAPPAEMDFMLRAANVATNWCDRVKRGLFYGTDIKCNTSAATSTSLKYDPELITLIHGVIGMFGEAGEMMEHLHAVLTGGAELDRVNLLEELGDLEWYVACVHRFLGTTSTQARVANIAKLDKRYPGRRFTRQASENRDLEGERAVLEHQTGRAESEQAESAEPTMAELKEQIERLKDYEKKYFESLFTSDDDPDSIMEDVYEESIQELLNVLERIALDARSAKMARQWAFDALPDDEIEGKCCSDKVYDNMVAERLVRIKAARKASAEKA